MPKSGADGTFSLRPPCWSCFYWLKTNALWKLNPDFHIYIWLSYFTNIIHIRQTISWKTDPNSNYVAKMCPVRNAKTWYPKFFQLMQLGKSFEKLLMASQRIKRFNDLGPFVICFPENPSFRNVPSATKMSRPQRRDFSLMLKTVGRQLWSCRWIQVLIVNSCTIKKPFTALFDWIFHQYNILVADRRFSINKANK